MTDHSNLLRDAGEAFYGPRWQSDLARDLSVSDRTMRRWLSDSRNIPPGVAADLLRLCERRLKIIERIIARIKRSA